MFDKLTDEQIDKAATWWANQVCAPTFSGLSDEERRDPRNRIYQITEVLALSSVESVNDEQREKFIEALKVELRSPEYNPYFGLSVDYGPDSVLHNAAVKAGVSSSNFPWKTSMRFCEDGSVKATLGYGAPSETI